MRGEGNGREAPVPRRGESMSTAENYDKCRDCATLRFRRQRDSEDRL